jgi:hypothetical protein
MFWSFAMDPFFIPIDIGSGSSSLADSTDLAAAKSRLTDLRDELADLKRKLDRQATLLQAMFTLVSERLGLSEEDLLAAFKDTELKRSEHVPTVLCGECNRPVNLRHNRCLYCGATRQVKSAFELL